MLRLFFIASLLLSAIVARSQQQSLVRRDVRGDTILTQTMPSFRGGSIDAFARWVREGVGYPQAALRRGLSGTVRVRFVVEKDGTVSSVEAISNTDELLNGEVVDMVLRSPKWKPGSQASGWS